MNEKIESLKLLINIFFDKFISNKVADGDNILLGFTRDYYVNGFIEVARVAGIECEKIIKGDYGDLINIQSKIPKIALGILRSNEYTKSPFYPQHPNIVDEWCNYWTTEHLTIFNKIIEIYGKYNV